MQYLDEGEGSCYSGCHGDSGPAQPTPIENTAMTIRFTCANGACGKALKVNDEAAGKRLRCPACGHSQTIPQPAAEDDGPTSLTARFAGTDVEAARVAGLPAANAALENPLSLQLLFADRFALDPDAITATMRGFDRSMRQATFEIEPEAAAKGTPYGLAAWGDHVIKFVGFDLPMPAEVLERCVAAAHYGPDLKQQARNHAAHMLLYYAGYDDTPLEQYVALAALSGALASHGAIVVANESGCTSFPAAALAAQTDSDRLDVLRVLPIPVLYCGFVKYNLEGDRRVWMRTHGAHLLGLPDLAYRAKGHHQGEFVFDAITDIYRYLLDSGNRLAAGETMQIGPDVFVRLREPHSREEVLESAGELLVMEPIREDEINRR
jgi:hypothetical protein